MRSDPAPISPRELFCVGVCSAKPPAEEGGCPSSGCCPRWSRRSAGCTSSLSPSLRSESRRSSESERRKGSGFKPQAIQNQHLFSNQKQNINLSINSGNSERRQKAGLCFKSCAPCELCTAGRVAQRVTGFRQNIYPVIAVIVYLLS